MKWNQKIAQIVAALMLLIAVVVVGGYVYLKSTGFEQFALRKIIEQADQATGGHTQIRALDFKLSTLTAHLYGVVIRGKESSQDPPLLQVDKLTVGLKIQSVFHREVNLSELLLEHPIVHLQVDRCYFSLISENATVVTVEADWAREGFASVRGTHRTADFGTPEMWQALAAGPFAVVWTCGADPVE